uniref:Peptidase M13 N-terminal domain-containing protein n=1 Tax=Plectus sambesii TaxID=2011161 RepID=A0A914XHX9_9BILA
MAKLHLVFMLLSFRALSSSFLALTADASPGANFVSFLKNGFNTSVNPCENFYDYVCSSHSSSSDDEQLEQVFQKIVQTAKLDTKYPVVAKALLDYVDDCFKYFHDVSYSRRATVDYLRSFGFMPLLGETPPSDHNFMKSLMKLVFLSPVLQASKTVAIIGSPLSIDYAYLPRSNTIMIHAVPRSNFFFNLNDKKMGSFNASFIMEWMTYQLASLDAGRQGEYFIKQL